MNEPMSPNVPLTRRLRKPELFIVLGLFLVLLSVVTAYKLVRVDLLRGDSALYFQVTENIASRGLPVSEIFANTQEFLESGILVEPAAQVAAAPLTPPPINERNELLFHFNLILYPIAALVRFLPTDFVLLSLYVLSYAGIVLLVYFMLRARNVPPIAAALFSLLVMSSPAWSESLLFGQFYPDSLFILLGFIFMYVVSQRQMSRGVQIVAAVACALVNEKAAATAAMFALAFAILYWKELGRERYFKFALGIALLAYGWIVVKFVVPSDPYYASFLPGSVGQVIGYLHDPQFVSKAALFLLVSSPFLILALFEWRAAAIAFFLLLPNVVGNIGGAEKVGWTTHYHSFYFPSLIWAAVFGYLAFYQKASARRWRVAFYSVSAALVIFLSCIDPYAWQKPSITPANVANHFLSKLQHDIPIYFSQNGLKLRAQAQAMRRAVPEGSVISMGEPAMPFLYHNRTIRVFPMDIDRADYAVLTYNDLTGESLNYGGATSYLGAQEQKKLDELLVKRMRKSGYDFANAALFPTFGLAIVKRAH